MTRVPLRLAAAGLAASLLAGAAPAGSAPTTGPLRVHPKNPRWFADAPGRAVLLVGSQQSFEWFLPSLDRTLVGPEPLAGGRFEVITAPFSGDALLHLRRPAR